MRSPRLGRMAAAPRSPVPRENRWISVSHWSVAVCAVRMNDKDLPSIYGKDAEYYFNDFKKLLKSKNFNLNNVSNSYFFQINRWDLVLNNKKIIKFPSKNLEEAIKVANKLLQNKDFNKYSVIDLRINNKIITQ